MAKRDPRQIIKLFLIGLVALCIIAYSIYQARNIISGPRITILSPENGQTVDDSLIEISGIAKNTSNMTINDRAIFIDEQGNFKEKILLFSGYNVVKVTAKDKFGRTIVKRLELVSGKKKM